MKYSILTVCMLLVLFSCWNENDDDSIQSEYKLITLEELTENQEKYCDKKVVLNATLELSEYEASTMIYCEEDNNCCNYRWKYLQFNDQIIIYTDARNPYLFDPEDESYSWGCWAGAGTCEYEICTPIERNSLSDNRYFWGVLESTVYSPEVIWYRFRIEKYSYNYKDE